MGRFRNLAAMPRAYLTTFYWGACSPWLSEETEWVVAQGLVVRETQSGSEVLLSVRRDIRGWELPGGRIEPGEASTVGLAREIREETALRVEVGRHVGDYVRTGFRPHTARVYICRVLGGDLRSSSETLGVRWFPVGHLPETLLPWYREPVADGLANLHAPVERRERQGWSAIRASVAIDLRVRWKGH